MVGSNAHSSFARSLLSFLLFFKYHLFQFYYFFFIFSSQAPDENEMLELMKNSQIQASNNTDQSDLTTSDDTITDRQQQVKK